MRFDQPNDAPTPPHDDAAAWGAYLDGSACEVWAAAYPEADIEREWAERHEPRMVDAATPDTHTTTPFDACPAELRHRPQWVLWRTTREGKKIPVQHDGTTAKTNDPGTWTTYERACAAYQANPRRFAGIGYVFADDDPYTGIDLDKVLLDGEIVVPDAAAIVAIMDSYTERSPSGTGLKLWVRGAIPHALKQPMAGGWQIEIYDRVRFFTVTGRRWHGTPAHIRPAHDDLVHLYEQVRPSDHAPAPMDTTPRVPACADDPRALPYAEAMLRGVQQCVLDAPEGQRHNTRLSAAVRAGRFAKILGEQRIFDALFVNVGDDKRNAAKAVWDGINYGKQRPATLPAPRPAALPWQWDDRWWEALPPEHVPDNPNEPPPADARDAEIARLRRALAAAEAYRDFLRGWLAWSAAVIAKPSAEMSANDKLTVLALRPEMEQRKRQGITELHPLFIGGACATIGASSDTYGASLRRLAEMGVIERQQKYDRERQRTQVLIRPLHFDTPDAWTSPKSRAHGGSRRARALPAPPICGACGPNTPSYTQDTTITAFICGGCGVVVDEIEREGKRRLHPQSCGGDDRPTNDQQRPTTNTSTDVPASEPSNAPAHESSDTPAREPSDMTPDTNDEAEEDAVPRPCHHPSHDVYDAGARRLWATRIREIVRVGRRGARRRPP